MPQKVTDNTYYVKRNGKYVPVGNSISRYDMEYLPYGDHIIHSGKNSSVRYFHINPAFAPMIAAGLYAKNEMTDAIYNASRWTTSQELVTTEQKELWGKLQASYGNSMFSLTSVSANDVAEVGLKVLQDEAIKLMKNEAVKLAYDQFIMIATLASMADEKTIA